MNTTDGDHVWGDVHHRHYGPELTYRCDVHGNRGRCQRKLSGKFQCLYVPSSLRLRVLGVIFFCVFLTCLFCFHVSDKCHELHKDLNVLFKVLCSKTNKSVTLWWAEEWFTAIKCYETASIRVLIGKFSVAFCPDCTFEEKNLFPPTVFFVCVCGTGWICCWTFYFFPEMTWRLRILCPITATTSGLQRFVPNYRCKWNLKRCDEYFCCVTMWARPKISMLRLFVPFMATEVSAQHRCCVAELVLPQSARST